MRPGLVPGLPGRWVTSRAPGGGEVIVSDRARAYLVTGGASPDAGALDSDTGHSIAWNESAVWLSDTPIDSGDAPWSTEQELAGWLSRQSEHCYVLCSRLPAVLAAVFRELAPAVPVTPVLLYGSRVIVGPTLMPRRAPCPRCWFDRLVANRPALRQRIERGHVLDEGRVSPRWIAGFVRAVWEAPRASHGPDHALSLNLENGEWQRQRLLPRAGCPCSGGSVPVPGPIEDLVGADLGVIHDVGDVAGAPAGFSVRTAVSGGSTRSATGSAAALDAAAVTRRALAEAAERLAVRDASRLAFSATAAAAGEAPEPFAPYLHEQYAEAGFPYVPLTADTACRWIRCIDGVSGATAAIPLQSVVPIASPDEPRIHPPSTTGIAAGASWQAAAESALLELAERDIATRAWYEDRLQQLDGGRWAERETRALHAAGFRCELALCETTLPVWVVVASIAEGDAPGGAYGVAAGRTLSEASSHAVEEAVLMHVHRSARGILLPLAPFGRLPHATALPPLPWGADVPALVRHYRPRIVDLTTNATRAAGLRVVSVFSPHAVDFPRSGEPVQRARWNASVDALARIEAGDHPFTS